MPDAATQPGFVDILVRRNADRSKRAVNRSEALQASGPHGVYRRMSTGGPWGLRLPREGVTGTWCGQPGYSGWHSFVEDVRGVTRGAAVTFDNNFPDFRPYAQATYCDETLNGTDADFRLADASLVSARPDLHLKDACGAAHYRQRHALTWHHHEDAATLLLIPRALHENVPHAGGASLLRHRRLMQAVQQRDMPAPQVASRSAPHAPPPWPSHRADPNKPTPPIRKYLRSNGS